MEKLSFILCLVGLQLILSDSSFGNFLRKPNRFRNDFSPSYYDYDENASTEEEPDTLVSVNVLFRHGNRTAEPTEMYPRDPYRNEEYYPFGIGQLTNAGKLREFSIGEALRKRYNKFLGPHYVPEILEAQSTDYNRTKMSLELVLAGLFRPSGVAQWHGALDWQPIPYNFVKRSEDKVLLGVLCPNYLKLYDDHRTSLKRLNEFARHKKTFDYISRSTGLNVSTYLECYNLFFGLATQEEWGFDLPEWTRSVWPSTLTELASKEYDFAMATTQMRQLAVGYFFQKVIEDTKKIIKGESKKKIFLYSAHESNVAELLLSLDLLEPPHVPTYGSYVILEMHKINGVHGVKIFYQNYSTKEIRQLKIPACESFCPMKQFVSLIQEYYPDDDFCTNGISNRFGDDELDYKHHLHV